MAIADEQRKSRNIFQRATQALRYGRDLEVVDEYQVGNIKSTSGVYILPGAALVGDIEAPKVIVAGLVYGYITADELIVEDGGRVWGDVITAAFHLEDGGKVQGWISSPDDAPATDGFSMNGAGEGGQSTLPPELAALVPDLTEYQDGEQERAKRVAIWRQLQNEAAVAIMARLELEKSFSDRVDEVAGESLSESSRLRDEVSIFREERGALQAQVEKLEEQLAEQVERFETKSAELLSIRSLLDDRNEALEELQTVFEQQSLKTTAYETTQQDLEKRLADESERNEDLVERNANLESALQGSLQHTAEQEEALIRWQELAEVTEKKVTELQSELAVLELQLKESNQVVEMLRSQRDKLEKEWEKANADLLEVVQEKAVLESKFVQQTERFDSQPAEYEQMIEKIELITANNNDLKHRLQQAERETQEYLEQWLWTKASLDTTSSELELLRETVGKSDEKIQQLQEKIAEQEAAVENWKNSVGRISNLLYEAEEKAKALEISVEEARREAADSEEKDILQGQVRMQQAQIEAYEAEVNHIQDEIERQSQNLAEMRATLIEREIALNQTRETAERQGAQLEHVKRMASKRIRSLEAELAETKHKLKDLSVWLERRNKRGESGS